MKREQRKATKAGLARLIWDYHPGGPRRVRVCVPRDGEVSFGRSRRTDEGYASWSFTYRGDNGRIVCLSHEAWRDCDGPGTYTATYALTRRGWQRVSSRAYDAFAQAANY